jgi:hypothetical protein
MTCANLSNIVKKARRHRAPNDLRHSVSNSYLKRKPLTANRPDHPSYETDDGDADEEMHGRTVDCTRSGEQLADSLATVDDLDRPTNGRHRLLIRVDFQGMANGSEQIRDGDGPVLDFHSIRA